VAKGKFSIDAVFKAIDGITRPVSAMQRRLESLGKATERVSRGIASVDRVNGRIVAGAAAFGAATAAGATVAAIALKDVIETGATFEKTMIGAAAKFSPAIRQGTAEFERLRLAAEDVGARTEFNAQQGASALKDLASAGFGVNQAISALPGVVDLATASEVDLATASEIASKSLGAFNLKTEDAVQLGQNLTRVNDVMARTADKTSAGMLGLFETIKEGGPVAVAAGVSIETFMAMAGKLADSGIEGSVSGTTLKNTILSLAAPTAEGAEALKKLGIATKDAAGNLRDPVALLGELEKKTAKLGTGDRAGVIEEIFGKIPIAGLSTMLSGGTAAIGDLRKELENAGGSTATMAGIMRDATKGDIDGLTSAIDGVKISLFGLISGPLRDILKGTTDWVNANRELIATRVADFLQEAAPILRAFAVGLKAGATESLAFAKGVLSVFGPLDSLFGGSASARIANAHELGSTIAKVGFALVGFTVATKVAGATMVAFEVVTKGVRATVWLFQGAIAGARAAMVTYQIATKAGAAATLAMSFPLVTTTADFVAQKAAALGSAVGLRGVGAASLVARTGLTGMAASVTGALGPIGLLLAAVYMLNDAIEDLNKTAGGSDAIWAGVKSMFTATEVDEMGNPIATKGFFAGMDEHLNAQAKATAAKEEQAAAIGQASAPKFDSAVALADEDLAKALAQFEEQLKETTGSGMADVQRGPQAEAEVSTPAERSAARVERSVTEMRDKMEITVKTEKGTEAEVTKKPKRAEVHVPPSGGASGAW